MDLVLKAAHETRVVRVHRQKDRLRVESEDRDPVEASIVSRDRTTLLLDLGGRRHRVRYVQSGSALYLQLHGFALRVEIGEDEDDAATVAGGDDPVIRAPMPGKVLEILVEEGQAVTQGQALVRVEAMKMEVDLEAPFDSVVESIPATKGTIVNPEDPLVVLEARDDE